MTLDIDIHPALSNQLKASGLGSFEKSLIDAFTKFQCHRLGIGKVVKPGEFGKTTQFQKPDSVYQAQVYKSHFAIDGQWHDQRKTTCNSYLIFATDQFFTPPKFLILSIVTPCAHEYFRHKDCRWQPVLNSYVHQAELWRKYSSIRALDDSLNFMIKTGPLVDAQSHPDTVARYSTGGTP